MARKIKADQIAFRVDPDTGRAFRFFSEEDGGPSEVLRKFVRNYLRRVMNKQKES